MTSRTVSVHPGRTIKPASSSSLLLLGKIAEKKVLHFLHEKKERMSDKKLITHTQPSYEIINYGHLKSSSWFVRRRRRNKNMEAPNLNWWKFGLHFFCSVREKKLTQKIASPC